jgi:starch synthase (maltosyl-transferring)
MNNQNQPGPRIFCLEVPRAGAIKGWQAWVDRALALGCDWLWLADLAPRALDTHPLAVTEPGELSPELSADARGEAAFEDFVAAARDAELKLVADVAPAFMARASRHVRAHPNWFVPGPDGLPAIPAGGGEPALAGSLVECDFGGVASSELIPFWQTVLARMAGRGLDAIIVRAAHRLSPENWQTLLAPLRGKLPVWAETLGATIEASEALAPVDFDAFFSSAAWWDFHAGWFLEQEKRLRRMAPTIALAEPPDGERATQSEAVLRYGFAATTAWGAIVRERSAPSASFATEIAAINALKQATPALNTPSCPRRLSAPDARATALAIVPLANTEPAALIVLNADPLAATEIAAGTLYTGHDARVAQARELSPDRSPANLEAGSRLALEPLSIRWFELPSPALAKNSRPLVVPDRPSNPIAIENITPQVAGGRYPVKRVLGERIEVLADLIVEGHARPAAALCFRRVGEKAWRETPFFFFDNDRWQGAFAPDRIGRWEYQVIAWRDRYRSWREETIKRRDAGQPLKAELGEAELMLGEAIGATESGEQARLAEIATLLARRADDVDARARLLLAETTLERIEAALPREGLSASPSFAVFVERARARTGAWYECFPRSLGKTGQHGTFDDLIRHLPYVADLGFDVLYLPPIHPIGRAHRKGKNNALEASKTDPGSPWAVGAIEGGHTAVHPELGTLADFRRLLSEAKREGLEVALDFAIQCSRDHPWLAEHPEWFRWRPDGSIRYAENPPKKYQDIVNVDFYCEAREALWRTLGEVVLFWCAEGVRIFRVDNPHTKPLAFWEWLLAEVHACYPDAVFLAEAFTRPKLMYRLAEIGFSQSYTYFVWRETKAELVEYLKELTQVPVAQFFRPNFWVNTPDINPFYLHEGARAGFVIRAVLAATLSPSWGMYSGYELCEHMPLLNADGTEREEYLDSEKYEMKLRDFDASGNIRAEVAALNRIRHENPALRELTNLRFHVAHNEQVMFYSKQAPDNVIWIIASLDAHAAQEADIELPLAMVGANEETTIELEELLAGEYWRWRGGHQHVRLTPERPALILRANRT